MKKNRIKISLILTLNVLMFFALVRCSDTDFNQIDCNNCFEEEPQLGDLTVYFSENISDSVHLVIYRGYAGENMVEWDTYAKKSPYILPETPVGFLYSVRAIYLVGSDTIVVVDADKLETQFVSEVCSDDCYVFKGGVLHAEYKKK